MPYYIRQSTAGWKLFHEKNGNAVIKQAFVAATQGRKYLKEFLVSCEDKRHARVVYQDDCSDDSDDEDDIDEKTQQQFAGDDLSYGNQQVKNLRKLFMEQLSQMLKQQTVADRLVDSAEAKNLRDAILSLYQDHQKNVLGEKRLTKRFYAAHKTDKGYALRVGRDKQGNDISVTIIAEPCVILSPGIGYFADRWNAASRPPHRNELDMHNIYSQAVLMRAFDPGRDYAREMQLSPEKRQEREDFLHDCDIIK